MLVVASSLNVMSMSQACLCVLVTHVYVCVNACMFAMYVCNACNVCNV